VIDDRWQGAGYSWPTAMGTAAMRCAGAHGIGLEATYTAKAFAAALELSGIAGFAAAGEPPPFAPPRGQPLRVLYWQTFSAHSPKVDVLPALPPELDRLFIGPREDKPPARSSASAFSRSDARGTGSEHV
jgi:hypothetical protein